MNRHYYTVPSVADPHDLDEDPDPVFHFEVDPDHNFYSDADPDPHPTFQFAADPDPGSYHSLFTRFGPSNALQYNDPERFPTFHFDAETDPDPAFTSMGIRIQLSTLVRIRIQLLTMMQIHEDPDPQH